MRIWQQRLWTGVVVWWRTASVGLCLGDRWQGFGVRIGLALLGLLVVGCGTQSEEEGQRLVVGLLVPLDTLRMVAGEQTLAGATLAAEEIEVRGGIEIHGDRIAFELVVEDTKGQPEVAISKALKLFENDGVTALLGPPDSESAIAVAKVAEAHGVPMISTLSTHPETTRGKKFVFRMIYTDTLQARVMADFAYGGLGARRVALLVDGGSSYSLHLAEGFSIAFERLGGQVVAREVFTEEEMESPEQLHRILDAAPEVLVLPNNPSFRKDQIHLVRSAGVTAILLGGDAWSMLPFEPSAERGATFFTGAWAPEPTTVLAKSFAERFKHRYGKAPTVSAALAYDAVNLLSEATRRAGSLEADAIRKVLSTMLFQGVSGRLRFDGIGDPRRSILILQVDAKGTNSLVWAVFP